MSVRTGDDQEALLYDGTHASRSIKRRGVRGLTLVSYVQKHGAIRQHAYGGWGALGILARGRARSGQRDVTRWQKLGFSGRVRRRV